MVNSAGCPGRLLTVTLVLTLATTAHLMPPSKASPAADSELVRLQVDRASPAAHSRLVRRSSGLRQTFAPDRIGDFTGQIGPGVTCGVLGHCGLTCCFEADPDRPVDCGTLRVYIPSAGGCVDCVIDPHPLCPASFKRSG